MNSHACVFLSVDHATNIPYICVISLCYIYSLLSPLQTINYCDNTMSLVICSFFNNYGNSISSRLSKNSEAFVSESILNIECATNKVMYLRK